MKIVFDINDNRADLLVGLMKHYGFVVRSQEYGKSEENNGKLIEEQSSAKANISKFQAFLEKGPVMDDSQYEEYQTFRKRFNAWRLK